MQLPQAYRSLARPSSPLDAKASTVRLIAFDLKSCDRCDSVHTDRHRVRTTWRRHPSFDCQRAKESKWSERGADGARATSGTLSRRRPEGRRLLEISRKEVIQPQVPLRLPCYDFAPVTEFTFGGCPLAVGPPTLGAPSFHGVTGGVYKARERIHRGVADPRLLAIPASCSRVADCNPNCDVIFGVRFRSPVRFPLFTPL